jgi:uncharacterized protein YecE (DUF72 family)
MNRWSVGTAGWGIASRYGDAFPAMGSHLERYSQRLDAVEINSSFARSHGRATWERWAGAVPPDFRFSVKFPKVISHERRLVDCEALIEQFLAQVGGLGGKLSVLLVQLPPSLAFDAAVAGTFFAVMRRRTDLDIAFEPRHASWFDGGADALLQDYRLARVAADPPLFPGGYRPAGWRGLAYFRLHGAPRVYYSDYPAAALATIEARLRKSDTDGTKVWCIFDNTAASHALGNALAVTAMQWAPAGSAASTVRLNARSTTSAARRW